MKNHWLPIFFISSWLISCAGNNPHGSSTLTVNASLISKEMQFIRDIPVPEGYKRKAVNPASFGHWLRQVRLSKDNTVYYYDKTKKSDQSSHLAVLDIDVGNRDLQQCADAVIRLRSEYLWKTNQKEKIAFHFTSGHLVKWTDYRDGKRPKIQGSKVSFHRTHKVDSSYQNFKKYLQLIFSYCGTYSLDKELKKVNEKDVAIGDVWIQTGNPYGHAVIVVDVAKNEKGEKIYLLAQSYMPAQSIHIMLNPEKNYSTAWFEASHKKQLETPYWTFNVGELKRFP